MGKILEKTYFIMIIFGFFIVLLCGVFTLDGTEEKTLSVIPAIRTENVSDSVSQYYFDVTEMPDTGLDIVFFSHHQFVHAFADGEEIYTVDKSGGIWGRTPGSQWNFIKIPLDTEEFYIEVVAAYSSVEGESHTFYGGDSLEIYRSLYKSSLLSMIISFLIIIAGFIMFIYGWKMRVHTYTAKSILYLGVFILIYGFWTLNESDSATLLFNHRITSSFAAFVFLMIMTLAFLAFVRDFMRLEDTIIWKCISIFCIVHFIVCLALQFLGIADLKETVAVTHAMMVLSILYVVIHLLIKLARKKLAASLKRNLIALILLIITAVVDMFMYYTGVFDGDFLGRFLFLIFTIIIGHESMRTSLNMVERGKKAKYFENLAVTDALTGLYSRTSYDLDFKEYTESSNLLVVLCDLNNLKKCNDTKGHAEGDKYIKTAASFIDQVFSSYGKCYRIGGDEFLVIIKNAKHCHIEELIEQIHLEEKRYNDSSKTEYPVHIAIGYSIYKNSSVDDLDAARHRADIQMYENKQHIKSSQA